MAVIPASPLRHPVGAHFAICISWRCPHSTRIRRKTTLPPGRRQWPCSAFDCHNEGQGRMRNRRSRVSRAARASRSSARQVEEVRRERRENGSSDKRCRHRSGLNHRDRLHRIGSRHYGRCLIVAWKLTNRVFGFDAPSDLVSKWAQVKSTLDVVRRSR